MRYPVREPKLSTSYFKILICIIRRWTPGFDSFNFILELQPHAQVIGCSRLRYMPNAIAPYLVNCRGNNDSHIFMYHDHMPSSVSVSRLGELVSVKFNMQFAQHQLFTALDPVKRKITCLLQIS